VFFASRITYIAYPLSLFRSYFNQYKSVNVNSRWSPSSFSENLNSFDVYFPLIFIVGNSSITVVYIRTDSLIWFYYGIEGSRTSRKLTIVRFSNRGGGSGVDIILLIAIGDESTRNYSGKKCRKIER
jgi:hypothetical protein